jgi:hypothetical protein
MITRREADVIPCREAAREGKEEKRKRGEEGLS